MRALPFLLMILVLSVAAAQAQPAERSVQASFCELMPTEAARESRTGFTAIFRFRMVTAETPSAASRMRGDQLSTDDVSRCIRTWKFTNFSAGDLFLASFRWDHQTGWTELRLSSRGYEAIHRPRRDSGTSQNPSQKKDQ
ncbi:MAG: hypothetical protein ACK4S4_11260 [Pyrinomonadaceae bacterium]